MLSLARLRVHRPNPAFGIKGKGNFLNTDRSNMPYRLFRLKFLKHSGNYMYHLIYYFIKPRYIAHKCIMQPAWLFPQSVTADWTL